jgi:plasmid stabilization system protein ParE
LTYAVRYTKGAREDLIRLYEFLLDRDLALAERALEVIQHGVGMLEQFPFSCRKTDAKNPFLRELIIPFGSSGYVALFEIENKTTVTILAVRHQREDDYF